MTTVIGYHEVNDTERWLSSPKREEFFGAIRVGVRTFVNPTAHARGGAARTARVHDDGGSAEPAPGV